MPLPEPCGGGLPPAEGPLGNARSRGRRRDAGDASSGTRRDAAKTPRDAAGTRQRRGTRPGREKKDARDHPGTEPTTTEDDPGTEPRREGREGRGQDAGPDAGRGRDAAGTRARRRQTPPDAAETPQTRPGRDFRDAPETPEDLAETAQGLSNGRRDRALPRGPYAKLRKTAASSVTSADLAPAAESTLVES